MKLCLLLLIGAAWAQTPPQMTFDLSKAFGCEGATEASPSVVLFMPLPVCVKLGASLFLTKTADGKYTLESINPIRSVTERFFLTIPLGAATASVTLKYTPILGSKVSVTLLDTAPNYNTFSIADANGSRVASILLPLQHPPSQGLVVTYQTTDPDRP